jgi:type II secretory pathway component GspD/PulD (secretin)
MKNFFFLAIASSIFVANFSSESLAVQEATPASQKPADAKPADAKPAEAKPAAESAAVKAATGATSAAVKTEDPVTGVDKKVRFIFEETDWESVIEWFADQAGYSLQPVFSYPEGAFTIKDETEYTVIEALDQLNHALLLLEEPYTLIRNRDMLVLWKTKDTNFPDDLIEVVDVEDLNQRGKFETIYCVFDVGTLDAQQLFDQLRPMISSENKDYCAVFPAANQIRIRETGRRLREIRDLMAVSQTRMNGGESAIATYRLKYVDSESFLLQARPLLRMDEDQNSREYDDGDLAISVDPFADRMFITGTEKYLKKFETVAALIDTAPEPIDGDGEFEEPYLVSYSVLTDPKLAFNVLDTMLEGLDVKMDQDEETGTITVLTVTESHTKVKEYLAALSEVDSEDFAIITLKKRDPTEVIIILQNMFRQTSEETATGPVMMAQSELNQIIVSGTPQEVANVKRMVENLDENATIPDTGPRTGRRIIDMSENEQDSILPMIEDLLQMNGRSNKIEIIMPEDRKNIRSRIITPSEDDFPSLFDLPDGSFKPSQPEGRGYRGSQWTPAVNESVFLISSLLGISQSATSLLVPFQETEPAETNEGISRDQDYRPAVQQDSVPGAPIEVKFTEFGMVLDSKDFDALDDLEAEIYSRLGSVSDAQGPQFYQLVFRGADEMLGFLEEYYGLVDSGGGGGGGAGGIMGGMMSNMLGGGGDLLGGLLGGDLGGGDVGGTLEGDVQFGVDMKFNWLWVRGATGNDIEEITNLIDTLDQPEPPRNPELVGEFYTIDVIHRDPTELKNIIEEQLSDLLDTGQQSQGGGQNKEAAQMMKMMQQLAGGGKGGRSGSADLAESKPKGKLGVDTVTSKILVTGTNALYEEVLKRVEQLDQADLSIPKKFEIIPDAGDLALQIQTLRAMFGDKIVEIDSDTGEAVDGSKAAPASRPSSTPASSSSQADAQRQAFIKAIQQRAQQSGGSSRGGAPTSGGRGGGSGRGGR